MAGLSTVFGVLTGGVAEALPYITSLVFNPEQLFGSDLTTRLLQGGLSALTQNPLSANAIINTVRQAGFTIRRQSALNLIRTLKSQLNSNTLFAGLPGDVLPSATWYKPAPNPLSSNYLERVGIPGVDFETGQPRVFYTTIMHNRLMTDNQIYGEAFALNFTESVSAELHYDQAFIAQRARDPRVVA